MFFFTTGKINPFLYINTYNNLFQKPLFHTAFTQANFFLHFSEFFFFFLFSLWLKLTYCIEQDLSPSDSPSPLKTVKSLEEIHEASLSTELKLSKEKKMCFIIIKSENRFVLHSFCNGKHLRYLRLVARLSDVCVHPRCLF